MKKTSGSIEGEVPHTVRRDEGGVGRDILLTHGGRRIQDDIPHAQQRADGRGDARASAVGAQQLADEAGIAAMVAGNRLTDVSHAIECGTRAAEAKYGRAYALALQQKLLEQQTAVVAGSRRIPV